MLSRGSKPSLIIETEILEVDPINKVEGLNDYHFFFALPKEKDIRFLPRNVKKEENLNSILKYTVSKMQDANKDSFHIGICFAKSPLEYSQKGGSRANVVIGEVVRENSDYLFVSNLSDNEKILDILCANENLTYEDVLYYQTHFKLEAKIEKSKIISDTTLSNKIDRAISRIIKNYTFVRKIELDKKYSLEEKLIFLEDMELYLKAIKKIFKPKFIKPFSIELKKFKGNTLEGRYMFGMSKIQLRFENRVQFFHEFFHHFENMSSSILTKKKINNYLNSFGYEIRKSDTMQNYIQNTRHNQSYVNYYKSASEMAARLFNQYAVKMYIESVKHADTNNHPFTEEEMDIYVPKLLNIFDFYIEIMKEKK